MGRAEARRATALLFGPALCWLVVAGVGLGWTASSEDAWATVERHGAPPEGSDSCLACHPDEWTSWRHSWHRTMTQAVGAPELASLEVAHPGRARAGAVLRPGQDGVLAPFAGEQLDYLGFRATMDRSPEGTPRVLVERLDANGEAGEVALRAEVVMSVGSHRYQQYVAELEGEGEGEGETALYRLPVAWHRAEARWIHMNAAFVEPEVEAGDLDGYQRHLSRWNDNCIFCHNTEVAPGFAVEAPERGFASEAGELGIACEACHGPATAHVARHRNPFRRLLAGQTRDGSITHPERLEPGAESAICGRCHGQRIAQDIAAVLREGDGFVPGDALASVSRPIFADSSVGGEQPFGPRFWPDGSPRLSAYEYQGLLQSPCFDEGQPGALGCGHCHTMHGDAPDGQLRPNRSGEGACFACHDAAALGGAASLGGHGGHGEVAAAVDCLDCHMPQTTYGLLEGMISHQITSPDPAAWLGRGDQPDACTLCHVDRSRGWAAASMTRLGFPGRAELAATDGPAQVVLDLLGGDPIQRNLAAHALAQPGATGSVEQRMAWIAEGLEDEYPSVRWFAWRGLRDLAESLPSEHPERSPLLALLREFDYIGPVERRAVVVTSIRERLGPPPLADQPERREALLDARVGLELWIGE
ncbi:hypothetical protein PPSIR1_12983 [Plesiocystis pacifica SIR-1]|uniref:Doubled CXXCH motif domain-containing protein n=1 Tax=Plesiocystis pacifica SIR-1 TaxID=391625 RepID=A6G0A1_9BACT|nr:cytochrome c3 family protein [Plesiocystis pacifica]EDM80798.1 hypothetical protein PPSIR1_12983 [Plesiocystis pacifica SIR-1]